MIQPGDNIRFKFLGTYYTGQLIRYGALADVNTEYVYMDVAIKEEDCYRIPSIFIGEYAGAPSLHIVYKVNEFDILVNVINKAIELPEDAFWV